jgi:plastocyanin
MIRGAMALAAAAALAAILSTVAAGSRTMTALTGTVGPGFTITLKLGSMKVTTLKAGVYRIVIADRSPNHNFVLEQEKGGKFERKVTTVPFVGSKTVTVKLVKGEWKYYCEPHESGMFGHFHVV